MLIKKFEADNYAFATLISEIFHVQQLSRLHIDRSDLLPGGPLLFENESKTAYHDLFYKKMNGGELKNLEDAYTLFIKNEIRTFFAEELLYQYMPSFRVHLPGDKAIHKWHYDSDPEHHHPEWELNIHIPLTNSTDTQSIWIESVPGLKDFHPINLSYGEFVIFDGNRCTHGNQENKADKTRVSFDFRVLPISRYTGGGDASITSHKKFRLGDYYRKM